PMMKSPRGMTTISGHVSQSLNRSPGLKSRSAASDSGPSLTWASSPAGPTGFVSIAGGLGGGAGLVSKRGGGGMGAGAAVFVAGSEDGALSAGAGFGLAGSGDPVATFGLSVVSVPLAAGRP